MEPDGVKTFEPSNIREGGTLLTDQPCESKYETCAYRVYTLRRVAASCWKGTMSA